MASPTREQARAAWRAAAGFRDLCALTAAFVQGESPFFPGWMADATDTETDSLADVLAALNHGGFLTCASHPAGSPRRDDDGRTWRRRAFVCGFARPALAARLAALDGERGAPRSGSPDAPRSGGHDAPRSGGPDAPRSGSLRVVTFGAREEGGEELAVGLRDSEPYLLAGYGAGPVELELFAEAVAPSALRELESCRWVWAVDLEWGRDDRLWPALAECVDSRHRSPARSRTVPRPRRSC